jgi:hypothetical protein
MLGVMAEPNDDQKQAGRMSVACKDGEHPMGMTAISPVWRKAFSYRCPWSSNPVEQPVEGEGSPS